MNLSPQWVTLFKKHKITAVHWSKIDDPKAKDQVIMAWASQNKHIVFTHDLDFSRLLALTNAMAPSVLQLRAQNVLPEYLGKTVINVINQYKNELIKGAIVMMDERAHRVRVLPL